jgi:xanthine dehydrogenase YagT iron-sulfur-binding subunit
MPDESSAARQVRGAMRAGRAAAVRDATAGAALPAVEIAMAALAGDLAAVPAPPAPAPSSPPGPAAAAPWSPPRPPAPAARITVSLRVNGVEREARIDPRATLLDALRDGLGLYGVKKGCDRGECGACTVLVEGRRINSCMTFAVMQQGRKITSIEGVAGTGAAGGVLHPVQAAFIEHDAFQCGYCTPGQVLSAVSCIHEGHARSAAEIREWMSGNLCRCGAYANIVAAVAAAAATMARGAGSAAPGSSGSTGAGTASAGTRTASAGGPTTSPGAPRRRELT